MTIIEPKKNKFRINILSLLIGGLVLLEVALSIFAYNRNVHLSYGVEQSARRLEELLVSNAEFENKLYAAIDIQNADLLAAKLGLVKEKKPDYLSVNR